MKLVKELLGGVDAEGVVEGELFDFADEAGDEAADVVVVSVVLSILEVVAMHDPALPLIALCLPVIEIHLLQQFAFVVLQLSHSAIIYIIVNALIIIQSSYGWMQPSFTFNSTKEPFRGTLRPSTHPRTISPMRYDLVHFEKSALGIASRLVAVSIVSGSMVTTVESFETIRWARVVAR